MTSEMDVMGGSMNMDEFDLLLNDVLLTVANPEVPERVQVHTRVWVREMILNPEPQNRLSTLPSVRAAAVFAPDVFLAKMQPKRSGRSAAFALLAHAAAIALVFWAVEFHVRFAAPIKVQLTELTTPPPVAPAKDAMHGGGGQKGLAPVAKGQLPKFAETQITPPKAAVKAKIKMPDATIEVQTDLKMANANMPNFGMPTSSMTGNSMGDGRGTGMGSGSGAGLGTGAGGNYGGGLKKIGGGVSSPMVIHEVEPEFSEEARRAKFMGNVLVSLIVDANGMPQSVHVARGVGMGLDEKAVDAVKQYRFKPAMENGKPVAVALNVEVNFQIF